MNKLILTVVSTAFISLLPIASYGASISPQTSQYGTAWEVEVVNTWQTTGNLMDGMSVTVTYIDGTGYSTETLSWKDNTGASSLFGWSLSLNDYSSNTYDSTTQWIFSSGELQVVNLTLDGKNGNTVFDILFDPAVKDPITGISTYNEYTTDSAQGRYVKIGNLYNPPGLTISATYSNAVMIEGTSFANDLYHTLSLDFSSGTGFDYFNGTVSLVLDTDNVNLNPVPEPTTLLLFGLGLASFTAFRARKK